MELNKPFRLPAVLGAETAAAEDEDHGMLALQLGEFPVFSCVVGKLIVGEDSPWNDVRSHPRSSTSPGYRRWSQIDDDIAVGLGAADECVAVGRCIDRIGPVADPLATRC